MIACLAARGCGEDERHSFITRGEETFRVLRFSADN